MHQLQVPLYIATSLRLENGGGDPSEGCPPLIFDSVESACRAVSAMADYHRYRETVS
jgi:hypothetical protein